MKLIGHRGARGLAPENSLEAIAKALSYKVDMVEIDVRTTSDNIPVLCHDEVITSKTSSCDVSVAGHSLAELKKLLPTLATLDEAFSLIDAQTPIYLELKPDIELDPVIELIKSVISNGTYKETDIYAASFSQKSLKRIQAVFPGMPIIVNEQWSGVKAAWRARQLGTNFISLNQRWLWSGYVRLASRKFKLFSYTLNDVARAKKWQRLGLAGVITDYPDRFREAGIK
ncbi:MAG TPA: glycerophosphodiester phosphodiesterase [Candidatus Saccharimonadales bacterium]|nr:glycerophosphodiester phosphodiesterase [Candidatus Saccharimonadales bacterium]